MAVLGLFIFVDYRAASFLPENMSTIFRILIGALLVLYLMVLTYVFPYTARFENNIKNTFKNALLISILNLPWTLVLVVCPAALVFVTFLTPSTLVYGSMLWMLLGFAAVAYVSSIIFRKIFAKYEPQEEENTSNPDAFSLPEEPADSEEN